MLLYEFAIIPDVFKPAKLNNDPNLATVLKEILKGLCKNGLVANLDKGKWINHVKKCIDELSPKLKDKIISLLNTLEGRNRLVRHPKRINGTPNNDKEWLDLALVSHSRIKFYGIIIDESFLTEIEARHDCPFIELAGALDSAEWENRRTGSTLRKCETDYREHLAPVLRHAKALTLLDPYINCREEKWLRTIRICAELMGERGHTRYHGRIHIHTALKHQEPNKHNSTHILDKWIERLNPYKQEYGHRFEIFLWEGLSEDPHDRFILTDQCGISAPGGLDCFVYRPHTTTWSLLEDDDRRSWLERIDRSARAASCYSLMDYREVT